MELKVWVEGIQRIVCGVTATTTCQDVVFALAHATGKIGRFTLIERWRNNERLMAPNENPLKILSKWGEYSNDVQFILQRSDQDKTPPTANQLKLDDSKSKSDTPKKLQTCANANEQSTKLNDKSTPVLQSRANQKSDSREITPFGIAKDSMLLIINDNHKSISSSSPSPSLSSTSKTSSASAITNPPTANIIDKNIENIDASVMQPLITTAKQISPVLEFNSADVRSSLDRKTSSFRESVNLSVESLHESYKSSSGGSNTNSFSSHSCLDSTSELYKNGPPISSNGALIPPPYRNPPSPQTASPQLHSLNNNNNISSTSSHGYYHHHPPHHHQKSDSQSSSNSLNSSYGRHVALKYEFKKEKSPTLVFDLNANHGATRLPPTTTPPPPPTNIHLNAMGDLQMIVDNAGDNNELMNSKHFRDAQHRDLMQLIKFQREKISSQQVDISKYDAEIVYLETKEREHVQKMNLIARELAKADQAYRQGNEQLQSLQYIEEENELVRQQEKTLKSEITLLRSKLANCETELLQYKNKIRMLLDDIAIEQRIRQYDGRQLETYLMHEIERIQTEIDQAIQKSESNHRMNDGLKREVLFIEHAIAEKKTQLERLVNEMKEVNLQSLTATSTEEIRHLFEGSQRPGSTRRIMGSPRQLETAVPTSKNPHGVWV